MADLTEIFVAVVITTLLGLGVGPLVSGLVQQPKHPEAIDDEVWKVMVERGKAGMWIGFFERFVSLISFWIPAYTIVGGWLAFKLAAKWEAWKNVIRVPETMEGVSQLAWYRARVAYGSWLLSRFLVGTLVNVLIGAVAAYCGRHSSDFVLWLCSRNA